MQCINPLLTLTTTSSSSTTTNDKIYCNTYQSQNFTPIPKDERLIECDPTISALQKIFGTSKYPWRHHMVHNINNNHKNCNCYCLKKSYTGEGEQCNVNTCPSNLLLQGSDDPLIGHGANSVIDDDHPMELRTLQLQQQQQEQPTIPTTNWSVIVKEKLKNKAQAKMEQQQLRQQQKQLQHEELNNDILLKFQMKKEQKIMKMQSQQHEYKSESNNNNINLKIKKQQIKQNNEFVQCANLNKHAEKKNKMKGNQQQTARTTTTRISVGTGSIKPAHENVRSWLKSIVDMQNNVTQQQSQQQQQTISYLQDNSNINSTCLKDDDNNKIEKKHSINYNDLPYMGEITLDNSRPRRGRKPKKANICHLIYKNYGTIILGEPKMHATCKSCVCNKRCVCKLTNKNVNKQDMDADKMQQQHQQQTTKIEILPLNLCLRDQYINNENHEQNNSTTNIKELKPQQQQHKNKDNTKHKRSTTLIPPKAYEHAPASPSVEVSIGKFKFTGGVNPLLQKKKMLSVDSVGNYIYFDGNDNKMLHVSEQQKQPQSHQQQTQKSTENLKYTTFPKYLSNLKEEQNAECAQQLEINNNNNNIENMNSPRKRKLTRRSEQRERLEKSFKEQGFLIQTQQMQSSEGATYCKFRQLKKFTRYLFRNWKDYLPNELQQQQQQQQEQQEELIDKQHMEKSHRILVNYECKEQQKTNKNKNNSSQITKNNAEISSSHIFYKVEHNENTSS